MLDSQSDTLHRLVSLKGNSSPGIRRNMRPEFLVERAIQRGEGQLLKGGAISVKTGEHTGRSPGDKFIVGSPEVVGKIWWENNQRMSPDEFHMLYEEFIAHLATRELFVQDLHACAGPEHRIRVRMINTRAWHSLFIRHLLLRPATGELERFSP